MESPAYCQHEIKLFQGPRKVLRESVSNKEAGRNSLYFKEIIFNKDLSRGSTAKAEAKAHVPVTQLPSRNPGRTERTLASSYKRAAEH